MHAARPSEGERFYLRALLANRASSSFEDCRTVAGTVYPTFQQAAIELGLFAHDREGEFAMLEAIQQLRTPYQLRILFVHLLINDGIPTPLALWDLISYELSFDFILRHHNVTNIGENAALAEIKHCLEEYGKRLSDYGLPQPMEYTAEIEHELGRWDSIRPQLLASAESACELLNDEQLGIFNRVVVAALNGEPLCLFVDGKAGRGKTFMVNCVCNFLRGNRKIVIATATSAYAAQLYPGGRTAHSAFRVRSSAEPFDILLMCFGSLTDSCCREQQVAHVRHRHWLRSCRAHSTSCCRNLG